MALGGLVGLAGNIVSGAMSASNNKKMEREQQQMYAQRRAKYEAMANEDPLARSEVQAATRQYDRDAERQIENARNVAAITGATPEYGLAVQKGVAEGKANLLSGVTANASARKDQYTQMADDVAQQAQQAQLQMDAARNETYANLAKNAANAAQSIIGGAMKKPTSTPTSTIGASFTKNTTGIPDYSAQFRQWAIGKGIING